LLTHLGPEGIGDVTAFLQRESEGYLADLLYAELGGIVSAADGRDFLPLLQVPFPELQEELAHVLAEQGDAGLLDALRRTLREKQGGASALDRALPARLADLFPPSEAEELLARALADPSAFVVEEGLQAIRRRRIGGMREAILTVGADPRWADNGRIQWLLGRFAGE
jgi:hypothetical protein